MYFIMDNGLFDRQAIRKIFLAIFRATWPHHADVSLVDQACDDQIGDDQACDDQVGNGPGYDVQVCDDFLFFFFE